MVNAVQEEDFSSANDSSFFITDIISMPSGLIKVINSEGQNFITREVYFEKNGLATFKDSLGCVLEEELLSGFLTAVRKYAAECVAMVYLGRAEHSRFQLERKLGKKGFSAKECSPVMEYLEGKNFLNDGRFAKAWLHTRSLSKKEGRKRLASELTLRGVDFETAKSALDDFFIENSEKEICKVALLKQIKKGVSGQKLFYSMQRLGFSVNLIRMCLEDKETSALA